MTQPSPFVFPQGQGSVSADQLNTFVQTVETVAQLRSFVGLSDMQVALLGLSAPDDGGQGLFYWNPTATGPDDGVNVIVPPAAAVGAWIRLPVAGNLLVTDGTHSVTQTTEIYFIAGATVSSAGTGLAEVTINGGGAVAFKMQFAE